jgi:hypothetical protein
MGHHILKDLDLQVAFSLIEFTTLYDVGMVGRPELWRSQMANEVTHTGLVSVV